MPRWQDYCKALHSVRSCWVFSTDVSCCFKQIFSTEVAINSCRNCYCCLKLLWIFLPVVCSSSVWHCLLGYLSFMFLFVCLVESNQKTSFQEIPKLNEDLVQQQKQLEQIETGELGLAKVWINITEINKQVRRTECLILKSQLNVVFTENVNLLAGKKKKLI